MYYYLYNQGKDVRLLKEQERSGFSVPKGKKVCSVCGEVKRLSAFNEDSDRCIQCGEKMLKTPVKWYFIPTDPAALEKYIRNCLQHKKYFAQVNGKWHVDLRVLFITRSPEDQHEVEQFFCRMVNYAANGNWDVFWQNVTPDTRSYLIRECGSLKEVQKLLSSDKQAVQIINELNDPQIQQQLLPFIIYFLNEGNCLKKIDGKYLLRHPDQQEF